MKTVVDSHMISFQIVEILWFYGIETRQSTTTVDGKTRYVVEVAVESDFEKAKGLFPLRKWQV